jgi:serine/threonine protein kinase
MTIAVRKKKIFDNRYEIVSIVGRGSDSVVYHAKPLDNPTIDVALKVLIEKKGGLGPSEKLRREALAMVSSKSQYVLQLEDFHSQGPLAYLCLEFAPETDLRAYTSKLGGVLDQVTAEIFLLQAANALHAIHTAGITHRDIKPENILVISPEEIRICDFGLALLPGETWSSEELQEGVGTFNYLAPELLEGTPGDERSDLYALGITFYELITGEHPFASAPLGQQFELRKNLPQLPEYVQEPLRSAVMGLIQNNIEERIQSASSLEEMLLGTAEHTEGLDYDGFGQDSWSSPDSPVTEPASETTSSLIEDPFAEHPPLEDQWNGESLDNPQNSTTALTTTLPETTTTSALSEQKKTDDDMSDDELEKLFDEIFGEIDDKEKEGNKSGAPTSIGTPPLTTPADASGADPFAFSPVALDTKPETIIPAQPTTTGSSSASTKNRGHYQKPKAPAQDFSSPTDSLLTAPWAKQALIRGVVVGAALMFLVTVVKMVRHTGSHKKVSTAESITSHDEPVNRFEPDTEVTPSTGLLPQHTQTGPIVLSAITPGIYSGTISGLLETKNVPLVVFSHEGSMTFVLGIDGFSPVTVQGNSFMESIKLASGGKVLELGAQELDGEIVGTFRNIAGSETGSFNLRRS